MKLSEHERYWASKPAHISDQEWGQQLNDYLTEPVSFKRNPIGTTIIAIGFVALFFIFG